MKLTKEQLKQIIKEELGAVMEDQPYGFDSKEHASIAAAAWTKSGELVPIEDFIEDMKIVQDDPHWDLDKKYVEAAYEWAKGKKKTEPE